MGRFIRGYGKYQVARWKDIIFPVCLRFGLLFVSDCAGCSDSDLAEGVHFAFYIFEANNSWLGIGMVGNGYLCEYLGSISFMNVIIHDDKNIIATYPIFLFYLFIDWFVIFI